MNPVTQVVFAAGRGTRLRPLTDGLPKALVPILDVPLLDQALDQAGVTWSARFVNVSHFAGMFHEHLAERPEIRVIDEGDQPVGTAATLRLLLPELTQTVLTHNCDLVGDLSGSALLGNHAEEGRPCTLAVRAVPRGADIVLESGRMRLVDRRHEDAAGFVFLGAACFELSLLETIEDQVPLGLAEGLLRTAVGEQQVTLYEYEGYAQDAGTPARYLRVSLDALFGRFAHSPPGKAKMGCWYIGPGAQVSEQSLMPGAIVGAGAEVPPSTKLEDCVVWPGSRVSAGQHIRRGIWFEGQLLYLGTPVTQHASERR